RIVFKGGRTNLGEHRSIDPDIRDTDPATMQAPWKQQVSGLAAEESDGLRRLDRGTHDRTGRAVDAAGEIDTENRCAAGIDGFYHVQRVAFHAAVEACAKQGIDDQ